MTDIYSRLKGDVDFRSTHAEEVAIGFQLATEIQAKSPEVVPNCAQNCDAERVT